MLGFISSIHISNVPRLLTHCFIFCSNLQCRQYADQCHHNSYSHNGPFVALRKTFKNKWTLLSKILVNLSISAGKGSNGRTLLINPSPEVESFKIQTKPWVRGSLVFVILNVYNSLKYRSYFCSNCPFKGVTDKIQLCVTILKLLV